jgi:hypothetical protein
MPHSSQWFTMLAHRAGFSQDLRHVGQPIARLLEDDFTSLQANGSNRSPATLTRPRAREPLSCTPHRPKSVHHTEVWGPTLTPKNEQLGEALPQAVDCSASHPTASFSVPPLYEREAVRARALEALLHQRVRCFSRRCQLLKPVSSLGFGPLQNVAVALAGQPVAGLADPAAAFDGARCKHRTHRAMAYVRVRKPPQPKP